jgi:60 kDa SS-A/Ro ribonucleoprotein
MIMPNYSKLYTPGTPQTSPIAGREAEQTRNSAGGFVFTIDKWARLDRFLILGSDAPTYYQNEKDLTQQNAAVVNLCWDEDPVRTANRIGEISHKGRAPRQDPAIFALALGTVHDSTPARQESYNTVPKVCRTASHLFRFMEYSKALGKGSGRGFKRVLANWYSSRKTNDLAYQAIKYRQRNGYTHKRAIELSNRGAGPNADDERKALYRWMRGKDVGEALLPPIVVAHLEAMGIRETEKQTSPTAKEIKELVRLIESASLPWEALPTWALNSPEIWNAMVPSMGMTALIRNLGNMTACGAITAQNFNHVTTKLGDKEVLKRSRVHPFALLQALSVYKRERGFKGSKNWTVVPQILDALDAAFYTAFGNVEPTNKRILLALDVSSSMSWGNILNSSLTPREVSAAMALITMATEPNVVVGAFTTQFSTLTISARQRLDDVIHEISRHSFGGTNCSLPFTWAKHHGYSFDAVVTYTDNETWAGGMHVIEALKQYRKFSGISAKNVVCGVTSTGFSIADPNDPGMLDVVGFDSNCPALISDFIGS